MTENEIKAVFTDELLALTSDELDELEDRLDSSEVMRYEAGREFIEAVASVQMLYHDYPAARPESRKAA